jgi:hypothetical protein
VSLPRALLKLAAFRAVQAGTEALLSDPTSVSRRITVAPDWRIPVDGRAPRLSPQQTIDVARPVGRWRRIEPRLPNDGYRNSAVLLGLAGWLGVVAGAAGLGWWKGIGPLRGAADLREFGSAVTGTFGAGGLDDEHLGVDDREHWIG